METGQLIVACDLGTTIFRAMVVKYLGGGRVEVVGTGEMPCVGFKDGDFTDVGAGVEALKDCLKQAETTANVFVSGFYYNVSGSHLRAFDARSQLRLEPQRRPITQQDVDAVMERAHSISIPFDHSILVANPVAFTVDGIGGISNPVDRQGSHLEVEAHLITGSRSIIGNNENTITKAEYEPVGWCIDILATSAVLLEAEEKERGVLCIDIGGTHSDWILFREGKLAGCGMVPCGGLHLSSDLAQGLRIQLGEAESVKRDRGRVLRHAGDDIDPGVLFAEADPQESPALIAAILEPRMEEILNAVKTVVGERLDPAVLGHGVVLTGGGARCDGTPELAEEIFGLPAEYRDHRHLSGQVKALPDSGNWSTCLGLIHWALGDEAPDIETPREPVKESALKRIFGRLFS